MPSSAVAHCGAPCFVGPSRLEGDAPRTDCDEDSLAVGCPPGGCCSPGAFCLPDGCGLAGGCGLANARESSDDCLERRGGDVGASSFRSTVPHSSTARLMLSSLP
jgi:hypothetical protein